MNDFLEHLARLRPGGEPAALGIITSVHGSSPQKIGAKALFLADGTIHGTLGGGCLEAEIQQRARQCLATGQGETFELVLDHDFGWDDGLICGGKVGGVILPQAHQASEIWKKLALRDQARSWGITEDFEIQWITHDTQKWIYQETVEPPSTLWIAGAGHIAQAVTPLAQKLDFQVTIFDDRPALACHPCFPEGTLFQVGYWDDILALPLPPHPTCGLIVTRGHRHDALVLKSWIHQPFSFLGMIGSKRKARTIFEHFQKDGIATKEDLLRVECPVGLDIDAVSVTEIAVSIMARIIQRRAEFKREAQSKILRMAS